MALSQSTQATMSPPGVAPVRERRKRERIGQRCRCADLPLSLGPNLTPRELIWFQPQAVQSSNSKSHGPESQRGGAHPLTGIVYSPQIASGPECFADQPSASSREDHATPESMRRPRLLRHYGLRQSFRPSLVGSERERLRPLSAGNSRCSRNTFS